MPDVDHARKYEALMALDGQEERQLRQLDQMALDKRIDGRSLAIARTKFEEAYQWMASAVVNQGRSVLPGDEHAKPCAHGVLTTKPCAECANL